MREQVRLRPYFHAEQAFSLQDDGYYDTELGLSDDFERSDPVDHEDDPDEKKKIETQNMVLDMFPKDRQAWVGLPVKARVLTRRVVSLFNADLHSQ